MSITVHLIWTQKEAAAEFGTDKHAISALVKALKMTKKPVPRCGKAWGLDIEDMRRLAATLGRPDWEPVG